MANDFQKREPTKTEKMLYELAMAQNQMERALWSTSTHVVALGYLLGADPQKLAEVITDDEKLKAYSQKINEAIKKIEGEKHKDHDHSHEGHDHLKE